jgi:hypothetical protein
VKSYNYLDLLNIRQLGWLPIHFHKTNISMSEYLNIDDLEYWIRDKLNGRFYLGKSPAITADDHLKSTVVLAFEEQKELTYFMLACPFLRRN